MKSAFAIKGDNYNCDEAENMTRSSAKTVKAFLTVEHLIKSLARSEATEVEGAVNGGSATDTRARKSGQSYSEEDWAMIVEQELTDAFAWREAGEVISCFTTRGR